MKNLKLSWEIRKKLLLQAEALAEGHHEVLRFAAMDIERNRLFFASSANYIYATQFPSCQDEGAWSKALLMAQVEPIDLEPGDFITSMDYLMEKEAVIIGTSYGVLMLYNVDDNATEIVGRVEGGVKCISPSPDGDLLVVITGFGQILVMTHDWDLLYETALDDMPEDVDVHEPSFSSNYSSDTPISWRGDGRFFATLSKVHNSSPLHKKLKIWERDSGSLHAVSEPKPFMGAVLDWLPSGAKIATVYDNKEGKRPPSIVFFERNGLERSSFIISEETDVTIDNLKWNCNSDLLAAITRGEKYDSLKIWFFNNNHWYLKQEIRHSKQDGVKFMWDPTKAYQLVSWTLDGQISVCNFMWNTSVMDNSAAFVIDDRKILITPLSLTLMPPPMYLFSLKFSSAVRDVAFQSKNSKNLLTASLSDDNLCIVELPVLDTWEELEGKEFDVDSSISDSGFGSFVHHAWLNSHVLLSISYIDSNQGKISLENNFSRDGHPGYCLQEIELVCSEDHIPGTVTCSGWNCRITNRIPLEEIVIGIVSNTVGGSSAYIQFDGGKVFEYTSKLVGIRGVPFKKCDDLGFPLSCPRMGLAPVGDYGPQKGLLFGLDDSGRLYNSGKALCNNCSSFAFYSNSADKMTTHLIVATKQDLLFIVDIGDILFGGAEERYHNFLPVPKKKMGEDVGNYISIWERGAKVMGVVHGDESAVILQTTRGNIECIYPRKLVLASIINALGQQRFRDALLMVRRHRIDFNIIIDQCGWGTFLLSAAEFVKQVDNLTHITEFVCSLKNDNVVDTLYRNYITSGKEVKVLQSGEIIGNNKVSAVLLAVRKALQEHIAESPARELCILTTLARSDPPALEEALERVKVIREMELLGSDDSRRVNYPSAEESLKHLLWLSDPEAVFEAALGLYDLNLAAIVALNSQKDPKEFLPVLQELESMPTVLMRYNIDLRLKRYEKALQHIISAGHVYHEDCMYLIKNNPQLFPLGLQLMSDPSKKGQVLEAWGDHLSSTKCFEDAATTYLCCSCLEKALKSYRACGNWKGVLTVAGLIKLGKEEIMQLAHELLEELQALGKPGDAAKIAMEYCADVNAGVSLLISARDWEEALRVAYLHKSENLVMEVKNASQECASMLIGEYAEGLEKIGKYLARYLAVRQRRLLLAAKLQAEERSINELDEDTASEASSSFSGMSAYTKGTRKGSAASISSSTSTKGRDGRRQRNRGKIRAGSPGEEMALVEHLKGMCLATEAKRELKSLLNTLLMLRMEEISRKLQKVGENFQLSQMAAVKLAEDAMATDSIDEHAFSLERYIQKVKGELLESDAFAWKVKVLV